MNIYDIIPIGMIGKALIGATFEFDWVDVALTEADGLTVSWLSAGLR